MRSGQIKYQVTEFEKQWAVIELLMAESKSNGIHRPLGKNKSVTITESAVRRLFRENPCETFMSSLALVTTEKVT